jgi:GAF domain-containing protein
MLHVCSTKNIPKQLLFFYNITVSKQDDHPYFIFLCMADDLVIIRGGKEEQYRAIIPQITALIQEETDLVANLANISAALQQQFSFLWIGFYLVRDQELVLGPFQGPVACTRIGYGKGVCGSAWEQKRSLIVPDVDAFPGHIACSSLSRSELVIPIIRNNIVVAVLDVDSDSLDHFDEIDRIYLEQITDLIKF